MTKASLSGIPQAFFTCWSNVWKQFIVQEKSEIYDGILESVTNTNTTHNYGEELLKTQINLSI